VTVQQYYNVEDGCLHLKVIDLLDRYCELSRGKRRRTQQHYRTMRDFIAKQPIANQIASQLNGGEIKKWMLDLSDQGYASTTIYGLANFVKWSYSAAIADNILIKTPFKFRFNFLPGVEQKQALTPEEQDSFASFLRSNQKYLPYYDMYVVLVGTGMRISEFAGLTITDIDFEKRRITVNKQMGGNTNKTLTIEPTKTEKGNRIIPMSSDVESALRRMLGRERDVDDAIDGYSGFVLKAKDGKSHWSGHYGHIFSRLRTAYNKEHSKPIYVTPHILRHTFCTNMAQRGMTINSLQYIMGHAQPATTMSVYTHNSAEHANKEFFDVI